MKLLFVIEQEGTPVIHGGSLVVFQTEEAAEEYCSHGNWEYRTYWREKDDPNKGCPCEEESQ